MLGSLHPHDDSEPSATPDPVNLTLSSGLISHKAWMQCTYIYAGKALQTFSFKYFLLKELFNPEFSC